MDAPLPVPTWMRVLLLMALRNVKEVAPRRNARGVPMGPLPLPMRLLGALYSELHSQLFALTKASLPSRLDEPPAMLKQRPRVSGKNTDSIDSKHRELENLQQRRLAKFNHVRSFCGGSGSPLCQGW